MIADNDERLDRIDRELTAALRVAPSPEFVPRVRERLAREIRPLRSPWSGMRVTSLAAAATLVFILVYHATDERSVEDALPAAARPVAEAPPATGGPVAGAQTVTRATGRRRFARRVEARVERDGIRPSSDLRAIGQLVAALDHGTAAPGSLAEPVNDAPLSDIAITPLSIPPLALEE
jgi:hypothetical protein